MGAYNLGNWQTVPAATPAKVGETGARSLLAVIVYGASAITKVEFKNAVTDTGTVLLTLQTADDGVSPFWDFTPLGGIPFSVAMFCKPVGTNALVYVCYQ